MDNSVKLPVKDQDIKECHLHTSLHTEKMGFIMSVSTLCGNGPIIIKSTGQELCDVVGTCGAVDCSRCFGKNGDGYCYFCRLLKFRPNVARGLAENTRLMREDPKEFFHTLWHAIYMRMPRFFRWHVCGEIESYDQLLDIYKVCRGTLDVKHGIYTRAIEFIHQACDNGIPIPSNLCINYSLEQAPTQEQKTAAVKYGYQFFCVDDGNDETLSAARHCPACDGNGKTGITCDHCGMCYTCKPGTITAEYLRL